MKCSNCGNELSADSRFCSDCGVKTEIADSKFCPECGQKTTMQMLFCDNCGARFDLKNNFADDISINKNAELTIKFKRTPFWVSSKVIVSVDDKKISEKLTIISNSISIKLSSGKHLISLKYLFHKTMFNLDLQKNFTLIAGLNRPPFGEIDVVAADGTPLNYLRHE